LGRGFFVVHSENGAFYTRAGQFQLSADGKLVNAQGFALQGQNGGDLTLASGKPFQVADDGTVIQEGQPVDKLAVVSINDNRAAVYAEGGVLSAPASAVTAQDTATIRQGAYEASNVSTGDEMVSIMLALRQAETGQKLVNVYDEMMGRVLDGMSQGGAS
jgi:flagellar basal body rod protein FlgG